MGPQYRFRAECQADVIEFLASANRMCLASLNHWFRVVSWDTDASVSAEVTIETNLDRHQILRFMRRVPDGHVMRQTLARASEYTGERNFSVA